MNWDEALQAAQMEADRGGQNGSDEEVREIPEEDLKVAPLAEFVRIEADSNSLEEDGLSTSPAENKVGSIIGILVAGLGILVSFLVFTPRKKAKGS